MKHTYLKYSRMYILQSDIIRYNCKSYNEKKQATLLTPIGYSILDNISVALFTKTKFTKRTAIQLSSNLLKKLEGSSQAFSAKSCETSEELITYLERHILLDDKCKQSIKKRERELKYCRIGFAAELITEIANCKTNNPFAPTDQIMSKAIDIQIEKLKNRIAETLTQEWKKRVSAADNSWCKGM